VRAEQCAAWRLGRREGAERARELRVAEQRDALAEFAELTGEKNYEPDQSFIDKVRSVFRQ
jgi:hypothetical protein